MEIICEFWCSPLRQEIYSEKYISLDIIDWIDIDEIKQGYIYGDFWWDVFGEEYYDTKGLWKVVVKIDTHFESFYDWEGVPDCNAEYNPKVMFKSKCNSWNELRCIWESLTEENNSRRNNMLVRELIEKLQEMDQEKEVWVEEYEGWTHRLSSISEGDNPQSDKENKVVFVQ